MYIASFVVYSFLFVTPKTFKECFIDFQWHHSPSQPIYKSINVTIMVDITRYIYTDTHNPCVSVWSLTPICFFYK